ncbi:MAG: L-amino acid N-acyltransferase YncA [Paracoccaceae bacterium]|jgi:L-amino acid N-acyltransferase YncA
MMTMIIRPIALPDVPAACRILNDIIRAGGTTAFETPMDETRFADIYLLGTDLICCHVVLDGDDQLAGFQWMGRNPKLPTDCADIATFARRDPALRGAGRALCAVTKAAALALGFSQINATIRADNVPGLGYYSKMGFVDFTVAKAVPLKDGTPVDRISKRLALA